MIIDQAQQFLAAQGVDQWQDGYPNEAVMRGDIGDQTAYVFEVNGAVAAIATLVLTGEPTYARVFGGAWTTPEPYACIHRVAVSSETRGTGVAGEMMRALEGLVRDRGVWSVRIDTHHDNRPMQQMLQKIGYTPCGTIYLVSGEPRIALEKSLCE